MSHPQLDEPLLDRVLDIAVLVEQEQRVTASGLMNDCTPTFRQ